MDHRTFGEACRRVEVGADPVTEASQLVDEMTTAEKLSCLDGDLPFWPGLGAMMGRGYGSQPWPAAAVDRLGVPGLRFADGPRGCVIGPATTFPVSMARGASFDPELEREVGQAIGRELAATGANYTGAVCMNLLRHPAWGRAQETYGEDPHHVGQMAVALTEGLQEHVMACMKHFALNSMENARFSVDVTADERALHEVYLPHFKRVVDAGVASVMSAYNSLNGEWCGDSPALLTTILRDEWGFEGFVITDFLAGMRDPVGSVTAGCNIEMPFAQQRAMVLAEAVADGQLSIEDVDQRVTETLATFLRFGSVMPAPAGASDDVLACTDHRALAHRAAVASTVLLSNDGTLPLDHSAVSKIAVLGRLADQVNLGDAGSSNVRRTPHPVTPLAGIAAALPSADVVHSIDDPMTVDGADAVIVVVGLTRADEGEYVGPGLGDTLASLLPAMDHPVLGTDDPKLVEAFGTAFTSPDTSSVGLGEYEGGDRDSLRLSAEDEALIDAACARHDRVIVAVVAGSAVVMPWLHQPAASLMIWYGGSEAGTALADVLLGEEPGGRLPFAVPHDEADLVPFDKSATSCTYGLLHGQWWLDGHGVRAHLPFGHGLSYASFELGSSEWHEEGVSVDVTNTSDRSGSTVVQVFGSVPGSAFERPSRRLVGFQKVTLAAGETQCVVASLDLSLLDIREDGAWLTEDQPVVLEVGFDAADLRVLDGG